MKMLMSLLFFILLASSVHATEISTHLLAPTDNRLSTTTATIPFGGKIEWIGLFPMKEGGWLRDTEIGLREDGIVVWRDIKKRKKTND